MRDFEYEAPTSVAEAVLTLGRHNGSARTLAGGTDLIDQIRVGRHKPDVVVDLKRIPELNVLELSANGLRLGAAVPCHRIYDDPRICEAYAALADWYAAGQARELPSKELLARAKELAGKALHLDPSLADAHNALGNVNMWTWEWRAAEHQFRRAIELNPGYSTAHLNYSRMLTSEGRFEEALREADRARELDPMPSAVTLQVGQIHYYARRYDRAMEEFRRILEVTPNSVAARHCLGTVYARQGLYSQAIAQFQSVNPSDPGIKAGNLRALAHTLAIAGRRKEATDVLNRLTEMSSSLQPNASGWLDWNLALVYAGLGDKDQAFRHLTNAYEKQERALAEIKVEPLVDNLRTDSRYTALLKKIGLL